MALQINKDYYVISYLGKNHREPVRQWMRDNHKVGPYIPELGQLSGDCILQEDYKEWIKTQQYPNGYP